MGAFAALLWYAADIGSSSIRFVLLAVCGVFGLAVIASGPKYHATIFHSGRKMLPMKRPMKALPSNILTMSCGAFPNQTVVFVSPVQRFSKTNASFGGGCFIAVRSVGSLSRWIR